MSQINWRSDGVQGDIRRRDFTVQSPKGIQVPAILSTPDGASEPLPLLLLSHGGTQHKTHPATELVRERLMLGAPIAVATIDLEQHGERGGLDSMEDDRFLDLIADPESPDRASDEWSSTLNALIQTGEFEPDSVAYVGLSLGGWFGFTFVANHPELRASMLGLIGAGFTMIEAAGRPTPERGSFERAPDITVPTAFVMQWDDQLITRDGALEAFELLGTDDKRLFAAPGEHALVPVDVIDTARDFLFDRLNRKPMPEPLLAPIFAALTALGD